MMQCRQEIELLQTILRVSAQITTGIIAEIGIDLNQFRFSSEMMP
jgi:hypothetical protein